MTFADTLLRWYDENRRDLLWRGTKDPYRIWLSEIMLQQTRTETVARYYTRFLDRFPTVFNLAQAPEDEVLKLWEGLGYYSRARNLHAAAKLVAEKMHGVFPDTAESLRMLPGVGPYAANAIASIAYNEAVPALDGNQARVLSRILAYDAPIKTPFDLLHSALEMISHDRPGDYNQALMDLGASICTPKKPRCEHCPVSTFCQAFENDDPESFPRKKPPIVKREEEWSIVIVTCGENIAIRKRTQPGLLHGLYEFPMFEGHADADALVSALEAAGFKNARLSRVLPASKHVFTHLIWRMKGWIAEVDQIPENWLAVSDLNEYAFSSAIRVYREIAEELF